MFGDVNDAIDVTELRTHMNICRLFSNSPDLVSNISIKGKNQVCSSDHLAITLELGPAKRKTFPKHKIYNFKKANWTDLINDLKNVNWKAALQYCDADTAWANFKAILFALCDNSRVSKRHPMGIFTYSYQSLQICFL